MFIKPQTHVWFTTATYNLTCFRIYSTGTWHGNQHSEVTLCSWHDAKIQSPIHRRWFYSAAKEVTKLVFYAQPVNQYGYIRVYSAGKTGNIKRWNRKAVNSWIFYTLLTAQGHLWRNWQSCSCPMSGQDTSHQNTSKKLTVIHNNNHNPAKTVNN